MHPLEREIFAEIIRRELIGDDEKIIVVAVSGGPDSVALLHLLLPLQREMGVTLVAAYIDHGLRPAEAEKEEVFVRDLCAGTGISFAGEKILAREYSRQKKISLEHAARELRYEALRKIAGEHGASLIAVGHTADDQAEEILIRLLRGSARKGLSGMRYRAGDIIRPLLSVDKGRILRYLEEKNSTYCIDSSNADMRFVRNRVRHLLLPFLENHFDSGIRGSLRKTAETLAEDESLLEELTASALGDVLRFGEREDGCATGRVLLDRKKFAELSPALKRRTVEHLLWQLGCRASYQHITRIVEAAEHGRTGTEIHLSRGLRVGVQRRYLEFFYPQGRSAWRGKLYDRR